MKGCEITTPKGKNIKVDRYRGTKELNRKYELNKQTKRELLDLFNERNLNNSGKFISKIEQGIKNYKDEICLESHYSKNKHTNELKNIYEAVKELKQHLNDCHISAYEDISKLQALGSGRNPIKEAGSFKRNGKYQVVRLAGLELDKTLTDFVLGYEIYAKPKKKSGRGKSHTDIQIVTWSIVNALEECAPNFAINANENGKAVQVLNVILDNEIDYDHDPRSIVSSFLKSTNT